MTVNLTSNFFLNARGVTLEDSASVTWSLNKNTNQITATASGGGGGGGVSSVGLVDGSTTPIYTISGTPVTSSGNLTFTLSTQSANKVFAGPSTGSAAQPTFRALVVGDLPTGYPYSDLSGAPSIPSGTVTSVGLADGSTTPIYTISGSPVTASGTLTYTLKTQTANTVFAGPTTGSAAQPTFRALVVGDIPTGYAYSSLSGAPSIPTGANPSASVGLSAVNGSAATFLRSDGAPALSQAIAPTWTGNHVFTPGSGVGAVFNGLSGQNTVAIQGNTATGHSFGIYSTAGTNSSDFAQRWDNASAATTLAVIFGDGGLVLGAPTSSDKGLGTLNATGVFVNGTAVSTAVGANPSASLGLAAVNGSATTFMRSDGAPALSQAITPTWTAAHIFTPGSAVTGITVNAASGQYGLVVSGNSGTGNSDGLKVIAGTNTSDVCANFANQAASQQYQLIRGDGLNTHTTGIARPVTATKTSAYSMVVTDNYLIFNGTASITLTLLSAATYPGREILVKTIAAFTVISASSNVRPISSATAGTAILPATAGAWALLVSDGTDWVVMANGT